MSKKEPRKPKSLRCKDDKGENKKKQEKTKEKNQSKEKRKEKRKQKDVEKPFSNKSQKGRNVENRDSINPLIFYNFASNRYDGFYLQGQRKSIE